MRTLCPTALWVFLGACSSTQAIPEGQGQGLIASDIVAPLGAETFPRPQWRTGDHYVYLRGGVARDTFTVEASTDGYRLVHQESGAAALKDLDLADVGQQAAGEPAPTLVNAPADPSFLWPLWVGKSWTSHFVQKQAGMAVPLIVTYRVEAEETLEVPAGSFRTLRILRSMRPATEEAVYPRQSLHWYAPEIGQEVRSLARTLIFELEEYRQQR